MPGPVAPPGAAARHSASARIPGRARRAGARPPHGDGADRLAGRPVPAGHRQLRPAARAAGRGALGTDHLGRDVLSRTIWASRTSLAIAFLATAIAVTLGVVVGAVSGYFRGWPDAMLMRLTDMVLAFPVFFIAVMVLALSGRPSPGSWRSSGPPRGRRPLALCAPSSCACARSISSWRRRAASAPRASGHGAPHPAERRRGHRHLGHARVGVSILAEASLSYLGLGVQPPTASWGNLVDDGREYLRSAWWVSLFRARSSSRR